MRILLVAPIHQENEFLKQKKNEIGMFGRMVNPFPISQGQNSWYQALVKLGCQVEVFYYTQSLLIPNRLRIFLIDFFQRFLGLWYSRFLRARSRFYFLSPENYLRNLCLILKAFKFKPDLFIISGGTTVIFPKTIFFLKKKLNCKVFLFNGMNPLLYSTLTERKMIPFFDGICTNNRCFAQGWEKLGIKKAISLPISSVEPKIYHKMNLSFDERKKYESDVCFVGSLTNERQQILGKLLDFNLKVWGEILPGHSLIPSLKKVYMGKAFGEKMAKIYNATKIALNFHPKDMKFGGNMRTFEICGCGAFQLIDEVDQEWFKIGKEIVKYTNVNDLKKKINYFLKNGNEREKIAEAGRLRAIKDHTYEKHFKKFLSKI